MPVGVELNGLLPGRGPGLGAPGRGPGVAPPPEGAVGAVGAAGPEGAVVPAGPEEAAGAEGAAGTAGTGLGPPGTGPGLGPGGPGRAEGLTTPRGALGTGPRGARDSPSPGRACACSGWLKGTCGTPEVTAWVSSPPPGGCACLACGSACGLACSAAAMASLAGPAALTCSATPGKGLFAGAACLGAGPWPLPARLAPSACPAARPDDAFAAAVSVANASLSLRTTGASIVDEADLTNSPISASLAITALLSTPNSLASSYTRTFATTLPASARYLGPLSRYGAAHAPSGVSSCCSSPLAHRALIAVSACLSGLSLRRVSFRPAGRANTAPLVPVPPSPACGGSLEAARSPRWLGQGRPIRRPSWPTRNGLDPP